MPSWNSPKRGILVLRCSLDENVSGFLRSQEPVQETHFKIHYLPPLRTLIISETEMKKKKSNYVRVPYIGLEIKMLAPWNKSYNKPRQHTKKQRHHFVDKGSYSQSYDFSSSHAGVKVGP